MSPKIPTSPEANQGIIEGERSISHSPELLGQITQEVKK